MADVVVIRDREFLFEPGRVWWRTTEMSRIAKTMNVWITVFAMGTSGLAGLIDGQLRSIAACQLILVVWILISRREILGKQTNTVIETRGDRLIVRGADFCAVDQAHFVVARHRLGYRVVVYADTPVPVSASVFPTTSHGTARHLCDLSAAVLLPDPNATVTWPQAIVLPPATPETPPEPEEPPRKKPEKNIVKYRLWSWYKQLPLLPARHGMALIDTRGYAPRNPPVVVCDHDLGDVRQRGA